MSAFEDLGACGAGLGRFNLDLWPPCGVFLPNLRLAADKKDYKNMSVTSQPYSETHLPSFASLSFAITFLRPLRSFPVLTLIWLVAMVRSPGAPELVKTAIEVEMARHEAMNLYRDDAAADFTFRPFKDAGSGQFVDVSGNELQFRMIGQLTERQRLGPKMDLFIASGAKVRLNLFLLF